MELQLVAAALTGRFEKAFARHHGTVARAAKSTIVQVAAEVKREARAEIARAGFGPRWQKTLRVDVYPKGARASINAAAHVWHKIPYAGVFEKGATIRGNPLLWLPITGKTNSSVLMASNGAKSRARRWHRMTPARFAAEVAPLHSVKGAKRPLLVANVGPVSKRTGKRSAVPVFVGVRLVTIGRRFSVRRVIATVERRLGAYYVLNLQALN